MSLRWGGGACRVAPVVTLPFLRLHPRWSPRWGLHGACSLWARSCGSSRTLVSLPPHPASGGGPLPATVIPHVPSLSPRCPRPLPRWVWRWVAAVVLNRDMGPIARLPSLGELPAAVLDALPVPRTPLDLANVPHNVGLPGARMQHALLCMAAAADGGMSMLATVSLQHVQDAMQQQRMHAPQPWEESAKRWLRVESVPSTHTVGMADMGRLVVLEGAEYWACVRVERGGLELVVVTACRLRRQRSRGPACYRVFRECLRELGPVRRAHRCTAEDIPPAPAVFVEVTRPPVIQGQAVWPIAPSNMWQAEHAAGMCRAL